MPETSFNSITMENTMGRKLDFSSLLSTVIVCCLPTARKGRINNVNEDQS